MTLLRPERDIHTFKCQNSEQIVKRRRMVKDVSKLSKLQSRELSGLTRLCLECSDRKANSVGPIR